MRLTQRAGAVRVAPPAPFGETAVGVRSNGILACSFCRCVPWAGLAVFATALRARLVVAPGSPTRQQPAAVIPAMHSVATSHPANVTDLLPLKVSPPGLVSPVSVRSSRYPGRYPRRQGRRLRTARAKCARLAEKNPRPSLYSILGPAVVRRLP